MPQGTDQTHAVGDSKVPSEVQRNAPESVEHGLPDAVHDTGSSSSETKQSHATGSSKVPETLQKAVPKSVEEALPESIHPTN